MNILFPGSEIVICYFETLKQRGIIYKRGIFKRVVSLADDENMQKH